MPHVVAYDPAYGYEIGHIVKDGLRRMYGGGCRRRSRSGGVRRRGHPLLHHHVQRALRAAGRARRTSTWTACSRACTCWRRPPTPRARPRAQLLASGVGVRWALEAQQLLAEDWDVAADVWSVTSWTELRRDGDDHRAGQTARPGRRRIRALRDHGAVRPARDRWWPPATTSARCRTRSRRGCQATTWRSAPTDSASPTPGRRPGGTSSSTARRWWWRPCRRWSGAGEYRAGAAAEAVPALPTARRHGRHLGERRRRVLTGRTRTGPAMFDRRRRREPRRASGIGSRMHAMSM